MGMPILLLRLEGPLQSWGARARWDVRDTAREPTKSGIVGLLGCALGYPVGDRRLADELDAGLRVGVRVEHPGRVMVDYQTISDFLPTADGRFRHSGLKMAVSLEKLRADPEAEPSTIVSPRAYLEDAAFLVALAERPGRDGLLARCAEALRAPAWPLYLGRKACIPTRPVFDSFTTEYDSLEEALTRTRWSWLGSAGRERPARPDHLLVYIEDPSGPYRRQDVVQCNDARSYGFRRVAKLLITAPEGGNGQ